MPSEHRLHPLSFLFGLGTQARNFLLPGAFFLLSARTSTWAWEAWAMVLFVPAALAALLQYFFYRYRYDEHEMVIRSGIVFRNERHVPYARIQNIDARQNVLHRLLGVAEVRVETGGGQEPEATMRVLPLGAFEEMRRRVFQEARQALPQVGPEEAAAPREAAPPRALLSLPFREVVLWGFIENRGMVMVAAAFGLLWELGLMDRMWGRLFDDKSSARGVGREVFRALFGRGEVPMGKIAMTALAFVALFALMRIVSMVTAAVRLHGFTLARVGGDLRTQFGLFTRVSTTLPLRRIQTLTIREGPLHRLTRRVSVRVDTAGGGGMEGGQTQREWLAPLVRKSALTALVREVVPELDMGAAAWRKMPPRAFRRRLKPLVILAVAFSLPLVFTVRWWALPWFAFLLGWACLHARLSVTHLGWAVTDGAVLFRSGWLTRHVTVTRFAKIQAVTLQESPFDRRASMANVDVDTAGAGVASHRVHIPYLEVTDAQALYARLSAEAARTAFRW